MSVNVIDAYSGHFSPRETVSESSGRQERRSRTRIKVRWPLFLRRPGASEEIETVTQNLSSSGFYCLSPTPLTPGETLVCTVRVPAYDPKGADSSMSLECRAIMLRAETIADGSYGIACRIEDYHLLNITRNW